jgi:hypothetical protein
VFEYTVSLGNVALGFVVVSTMVVIAAVIAIKVFVDL